MTPNDLLSITEASGDDGVLRIGQIVAPIFRTPTDFRILGPSATHVVTEEMADALNELLATPTVQIEQIEAILSEDCDVMCRETGFDIWDVKVEVGQDQDPLEAHRLAFGMSAQGRIPSSRIAKWVSFIGLDVPNGAFVKFTPPWSQDYGVLVSLEDGAFTRFNLRYYQDDEDEFRLPMPD